MSILSDRKSVLAKLMATENITVCHMPVKTASFDMQNRVLRCPMWQDMSSDLYDLFMGHEVGHALNTPAQGWHDAIELRGKKFKSFLNVIEDARIEKLIQRRYPGLRRSFHMGYKELLARNFFGGVQKLPTTDHFNLIDRINIHFKLSPTVQANFTPEEQVFVDRTTHVETWEQVEKIAADVFEYVKKNESHKPQDQTALDDLINEILKNMEQSPADENSETQVPSEDEKSEESKSSQQKQDSKKDSKPKEDKAKKEKSEGGKDKSKEDGEDTDSGADGKDSDSEKDSDAESGNDTTDDKSDESEDACSDSDSDSDKNDGADGESGDSGESDDDSDTDGGEDFGQGAGSGGDNTKGKSKDVEPNSVTDDAFRENEESLVDMTSFPSVQYYMPEVYLDNIIVPNSEVVNAFERGVVTGLSKIGRKYETVAPQLSALFHKRNTKYIALLVKEFEMRKNATQYSRQLESKSGDLDTKRLHKYKFSSDIFRKVTAVEKGKDHGMIMFVDMSGSMSGNMTDTIEQVLVLATFCKKVSVPFEVYGFCDAGTSYYPSLSYSKLGGNQKFESCDINKKNFSMIGDGGGFHLKTLLSSSLSQTNFRKAFNMLVTYAVGMSYTGSRPEEIRTIVSGWRLDEQAVGMNLHGTPYSEAILASKPIIKNFRTRNHTDIVNVIYLTDGVGNWSSIYSPWAFDVDSEHQYKVLVDRDTGQSVKVDHNKGVDEQAAMTILTQKITGCRHIGIYIGSPSDLEGRISKYHADPITGQRNSAKTVAAMKLFNEQGFAKIKQDGYDSYYLMPLSSAYITEKFETTIPNPSTDQMQKEFSHFLRAKNNKRFLCSAFSKEISVRL